MAQAERTLICSKNIAAIAIREGEVHQDQVEVSLRGHSLQGFGKGLRDDDFAFLKGKRTGEGSLDKKAVVYGVLNEVDSRMCPLKSNLPFSFPHPLVQQ